MKQVSTLRISIIVLITVLSIVFTLPTARYYMHLRHQPGLNEPAPLTSGPEPDKSKIELHEAWVNENPEYIAWREAHPDYVVWEEKASDLRDSAIPLGLDLRGGVDVTLKIDEKKALSTEIDSVIEVIEKDLQNEQIKPVIAKGDRGASMTIQVSKEDSRGAASIVSRYIGRIEGDASAVALENGSKFTIETSFFVNQLNANIEGAKKAISDRVDSMGVTQPKVTVQDGEKIRIQVPGEKNPDRLIANVIKPAFLELKLVSQQNEDVLREAIRADGTPDPNYILPAGTELVKTNKGYFDKDTQQMKYVPGWELLNSRAELTGENLSRAYMDIDPTSVDPIMVRLEFDKEGTAIFAEVSKENIGRQLAIVLDGTVRSDPVLQTAITEGRCQITGGFKPDEAKDLSMILKAGSLPAPLVIESKHTVGATLGGDSILSGVKALLIGTSAVVVFMIAYYGMAGVIAVIALILNVLLITAIMALSRATLTLSGIGGILLTIGMASDANVLIYERIREELAAGRPMRQAIGLGFNRAFTVILDSNLTTLLTALVLLQFTDGSVFGFALTMVFGLLANFYTGLTVTYTLCALWFQWRDHLSLGALKLPKMNVPFIKMRLGSWTLSTIVFLGGALLLFGRGGLQYSVDFEGGVKAEAVFNQDVDANQIRTALSTGGIDHPRVQAVTDQANAFIVDTRSIEVPEANTSDLNDLAYTENLLRSALDSAFGEDSYEMESVTSFGAETSTGFAHLAILVVILASCAILVYLWFRFEFVFGAAAVVALIHDLFITLVIAEVWGVQISLEVVAALMVLLGFSVNDTIVIFDRIRENTRTMANENFEKVCNTSMNQSLPRTLITSVTTWFAVGCLLFLGGEGLSSFAKVLFTGVIIGTYSSDFLAAPLVYQWNKMQGDKLQKTLSAKKKKRTEAQPIRSAGAATRPSSK